MGCHAGKISGPAAVQPADRSQTLLASPKAAASKAGEQEPGRKKDGEVVPVDRFFEKSTEPSQEPGSPSNLMLVLEEQRLKQKEQQQLKQEREYLYEEGEPGPPSHLEQVLEEQRLKRERESLEQPDPPGSPSNLNEVVEEQRLRQESQEKEHILAPSSPKEASDEHDESTRATGSTALTDLLVPYAVEASLPEKANSRDNVADPAPTPDAAAILTSLDVRTTSKASSHNSSFSDPNSKKNSMARKQLMCCC